MPAVLHCPQLHVAWPFAPGGFWRAFPPYGLAGNVDLAFLEEGDSGERLYGVELKRMAFEQTKRLTPEEYLWHYWRFEAIAQV